MSVSILVPIKTINERLPGKNTRPLKGKPLYAYLFRTLQKVICVDAVYIDSSDDEILDIARDWGFKTLKRPEEYNSNLTTGDELIMRAVDLLDCDIIVELHVTNPFLGVETIEEGIRYMVEDGSLDSVFGVKPIYNRFWFEGRPVNHDVKELKRTQNLTPVHEETDVYFVRSESFRKYKKRVCGKFKHLEMNTVEAVDIDTIEDFVIAEAFIDAGLVKT